jgi:hypothetical protein
MMLELIMRRNAGRFTNGPGLFILGKRMSSPFERHRLNFNAGDRNPIDKGKAIMALDAARFQR